MKKILFAIFAVILLVPSAYSDDLGYISMASSTSDVMNSVISAGAIINAFSDYGTCGFLTDRHKNNIAELIYGSLVYTVDSEGKTVYNKSDITVQEVYDVLYVSLVEGAGSGKEESSKQNEAQRCLMAIIERHNAIVRDAERQKQELQSAEWQKGKIFTSEQEYNDTLRAKGKCRRDNSSSGVHNRNRSPNTLNKCKEFCRDVAIANACFLEAVVFSRKNYVDCSCDDINQSIKDNPRDVDSFFNQNPYYFIPTWEDYKKLYNMK